MSGAGSWSRRAYDTFTRYAAISMPRRAATARSTARPGQASQARRTVHAGDETLLQPPRYLISSRAPSIRHPLCSISTSSCSPLSSALIGTQIGTIKTKHCFHRRLHNTFGTSNCVTEPIHTIAPTLLVLFRRIYSATSQQRSSGTAAVQRIHKAASQ